jgi:hypothetical protein
LAWGPIEQNALTKAVLALHTKHGAHAVIKNHELVTLVATLL